MFSLVLQQNTQEGQFMLTRKKEITEYLMPAAQVYICAKVEVSHNRSCLAKWDPTPGEAPYWDGEWGAHSPSHHLGL